jgi:dienelactone hydrolase
VALIGILAPRRRIVVAFALSSLATLAGMARAAEALAPSLREEVIYIDKPGRGGVKLETTLFRPPGDGPFPLVIINHGKSLGDPHGGPRVRYLLAAREFLSRGYAVATPMRQGFAESTGPYISDGCDIEANGKAQAVDVAVTIAALSRRPDIDASHTVVMGQSHGGLTTMALGSLNPKEVVGLVNFAGGLRMENCSRWRTDLTSAMRDFGARGRVPSLWFYGDNDQLFDTDLWQGMYQVYTEAGGRARMVAFGKFRDNSHMMFGSSAGLRIWVPEVGKFFRELGLPFDVRYRVVLADHETPPPPASGFAPIDDATRIPLVNDTGRAAWVEYLGAPPPKAFAVSPHGRWYYRYGDPAAMREALERCGENRRQEPCQLYAVDDDVVWRAEASPTPSSQAAAATN